MKQRSIIQKLLAFVMLLVFSFAVTPKVYLHDLIADHTDYCGFTSGDEIKISKTGFDCDTEDLVVPTSFIEGQVQRMPYCFIQYNDISYTSYHFHFLSFYTTKDSRGPPGMA